ncbi:LPS-assembly protein LptD @ Organic solvent tolerance protein precursor [hydrothermal vent metagenome]|uniref:LPS-assembly protein LptD @ Organic solvent tolerance protein n=1 Tax=hydrothermal vent metagenome TaxID=652676 RepID=A0A3B1B5W9_9ZZZZ
MLPVAISSLLLLSAAQAAKPTWECRTAPDGATWECFKDGLPAAAGPLDQPVTTAPVAEKSSPAVADKPSAAVQEEPVIAPAIRPAHIAAPVEKQPAPVVTAKEPIRPPAPVQAKPVVPTTVATTSPDQSLFGPRIDRGLNWSQCSVASGGTPTPRGTAAISNEEAQTHISSDAAEIRRNDEESIFSGNVEVIRGSQVIEANEIRYNNKTDNLHAQGDVYYQEPGLRISGTSATFDMENHQGQIEAVEYRLPYRMARGSADKAEIQNKDQSRFDGISYTTCRPGSNSWVLRADTMDIDQATGRGEARNVILALSDMPVFYLPYISFPIDDRRKTGMLAPSMGQSDETGTDISMPYYLNLAPNYDATITPRVMSKRGLMLAGELRYLTGDHSGIITGEILPDDDEAPKGQNKTRGAFSIKGRGWLTQNISVDANINHVSDDEYLEDFGGSLAVSSTRQMERRADITYHGEYWSLLGRVQHFQSLDETLASTSRAYNRLPQVRLALNKPDQLYGLTYHLNAEYAWFDRSIGVRGHRYDLHPGLSLPMSRSWGFITPKITARYTGYQLEDEAIGATDDPDRFLGTLSIDSGLYFDRQANWFGSSVTQTIEPRAFYLLIPREDQDDQPIFDTSKLSFSFANLFRENRFNGADRVGDANQLTLAVTSRTLGATGKELLRASIGSIIYFRDRTEQLPGGRNLDEETSAIVAEMGARLTENWSTRASGQWDPHNSDHTDKSAFQLHYRDEERRILNLAYRFTRDVSEQTDFSGRLPLFDHLTLVGRWNYSLRYNQTMEGFGGIEYDGCCYVARAVVRNYVNKAGEEANTGIFLQIEFKGLGSVGSDIITLLDRGIFGYAQNE